MIILGGMSFTFLKVAEGVKIGKSLYDEEGAKIINQLLEKAKQKNVKIMFPVDFKIADDFKADANTKFVTKEEGIPDDWQGLDIGPKSIEKFSEVIATAHTIVWNGPAGVYEFEAFQAGTRGILDAVAKSTAAGNLTVIGGGDCGACAMKWGYKDKLTHISTGGGASLELLEGNEMPGLVSLSDKQ